MNNISIWTSSENALCYLGKADRILHTTEEEALLLSQVPKTVKRILDL